jgi:hypothetical protein
MKELQKSADFGAEYGTSIVVEQITRGFPYKNPKPVNAVLAVKEKAKYTLYVWFYLGKKDEETEYLVNIRYRHADGGNTTDLLCGFAEFIVKTKDFVKCKTVNHSQ